MEDPLWPEMFISCVFQTWSHRSHRCSTTHVGPSEQMVWLGLGGKRTHLLTSWREHDDWASRAPRASRTSRLVLFQGGAIDENWGAGEGLEDSGRCHFILIQFLVSANREGILQFPSRFRILLPTIGSSAAEPHGAPCLDSLSASVQTKPEQ